MAKVSLSIIIPTLNRPSLQNVLKGIKACEGYDEKIIEILVIENLTTSQARNKGLDQAQGEIIAFLGDDTIPDKNWLQKVLNFHKNHPEPKAALLGKVSWTDALAQDPFHQWLECNAQFQWNALPSPDKGRCPKGGGVLVNPANAWKFFYTSNISLKKSFINEERFSTKFKGWGFEDTELGYRLSQKGMKLHFDASCEVLHDHEMTEEGLIQNTRNARKNAAIFEKLHPKVNILPSNLKKIILKLLIILTWPLQFISKKTYWWRIWKKNWLG